MFGLATAAMSALPPFSAFAAGTTGLPGAGRASFGQAAASAMSMKWSALQDAAAVVATLAGLQPEQPRTEVRNFPATVRDAGGWRRETAERGIDDLSLVMETGIAALLAVHGRGVDPRAAALALWREYQTSRAALLALVPAGMARRAF